jgi:hypothetical protein
MRPARVWLRRIALATLVLLFALASLTAHAVIEGEAQMRLSDAAFNQGDVRQAAHHARRAAVHYAPGAPHVRAAYQRLMAVAAGAEAVGDTNIALFAWRTMRGAAQETQHLLRVHSDQEEAANQALARLQVAEKAPDTKLEAARQHKIATRDLAQGVELRAGWILLLSLGFSLTCVGLAWFCLRGVDPDGALRWSAARSGAVLFVIGLTCWTWAVVTA